jgi:hypothetical protein
MVLAAFKIQALITAMQIFFSPADRNRKVLLNARKGSEVTEINNVVSPVSHACDYIYTVNLFRENFSRSDIPIIISCVSESYPDKFRQ